MVNPVENDADRVDSVLRRIRLCENGNILQILDDNGNRVVLQRDAAGSRLSHTEQIRMFMSLGLDPQELELVATEMMKDEGRPTSERLALLATIAGCYSVSKTVRQEIEAYLLQMLSSEATSLSMRAQVVRLLASLGNINCEIAGKVLRFFQLHGTNLNDAFAVQYFVEKQSQALKALPSFAEFESGVARVPSICTSYMLKILRG